MRRGWKRGRRGRRGRRERWSKKKEGGAKVIKKK